ncbi:hypothetical protein K458DRAFT_432466 [Lentithecium fluviatile CBS 122367]|uniref:Uncharacterized protein n=1 Tax=Lentithecium fluviatile CBS 122367 TaxID=1168545 RepID=A0A6G1IYP9_9PLEO|nr:hypothetical protein K458DRAFT_432466 [Lentithecium fluviatile CBS 122367]
MSAYTGPIYTLHSQADGKLRRFLKLQQAVFDIDLCVEKPDVERRVDFEIIQALMLEYQKFYRERRPKDDGARGIGPVSEELIEAWIDGIGTPPPPRARRPLPLPMPKASPATTPNY